MEEREEFEQILSNLRRIEIDPNSNEVISESKAAIKFVEDRMEFVENHFWSIIHAPCFMMYPDILISSMMHINGGKKLLLENLDEILIANSHQLELVTSSLIEIDGLGEVLLDDFENKFDLFVGSTRDLRESYADDINSEQNICSYEAQVGYAHFVHATMKSKNVAEIFEKNKDILINPLYNTYMPILVATLVRHPKFHKFLADNFEEIKNASMEKDIVPIYKLMKDIIPEEYEKQRFIIEEIYNPGKIMLNEEKDNLTSLDFNIMSEQIQSTCGRIIVQNHSKNIEEFVKHVSEDGEFEVKNVGAYSIAIKAGDKFVKVGGSRAPYSDFEIIDHPRLLRPIIRKKDVSIVPEHPLYIELQDEVDTETEITDEDLLMVYKELREAGIKWCDVKKNNLGRLKKDNYGFPVGQGPEAPNKALGLIGDDKDRKILKAGDLVIIDLDLIFRADYRDAQLNAHAPAIVKEFEEKFAKKEREAQANSSQGDEDYGEK